jgi:hypothetical protein
VIAIIAILAAILFPVFAQAKAAAKKTAAISNQKQIGLGMIMYAGDWDDKYPQTDGCDQGSSLNPKFKAASYNGAAGMGCTGGLNYNRVNTYSWQKWVMPYVKNVDLFVHPGRQKDPTMWDTHGEIMNGFALNPAITGSANVNVSTGQLLRTRNSWLGGTQSSIPDVAGAMILMEFGSTSFNFAPMVMTTADYNLAAPATQTVYPQAYREYWGRILMKWDTCSGPNMNEISSEVDPRGAFANGVVLGMADGSAKFFQAKKFLGATPTVAEYGAMDSYGQCGRGSEVMRVGSVPNLKLNYPLWGLTAQ